MYDDCWADQVETCMTCFGSGFDPDGDECPDCNGDGLVLSPWLGEGEMD